MPQQHLSIDPLIYNTMTLAGFTPPKPAMEPFTLIPFHSWIEHPDHGMVPTYGPTEENSNVVITIPVINDPTPSDELQTRAIQYYAYLLDPGMWVPGMQTVDMKVIRDVKLNGLVDSTNWASGAIFDYRNYLAQDIFSRIKEYSLERWGQELTEDMEYEVFGRINPNDREPADEVLPFSEMLDELLELHEKLDGWVTVTGSTAEYVSLYDWESLVETHGSE